MVDAKALGVGSLLIMFIGIIVVLAIAPEIATQQTEMTTKNDVVNEAVDISTARDEINQINITVSNFTIANEPTGWKIDDCPIESITYGNATADWVDGTDYNFYESSGILQVLNSTTTAVDSIGTNDTVIDYTFCLDGYITSTGGRSIAGLILLFSMLGLVAYTIYYAVRHWF